MTETFKLIIKIHKDCCDRRLYYGVHDALGIELFAREHGNFPRKSGTAKSLQKVWGVCQSTGHGCCRGLGGLRQSPRLHTTASSDPAQTTVVLPAVMARYLEGVVSLVAVVLMAMVVVVVVVIVIVVWCWRRFWRRDYL